MANQPYIQIYHGDWLRDAIAGCSLAAQGLWLRMKFIMADSERYGYLVMDGQAMPSESIARRCGCTLDEYLTLLAELDRNRVTSYTRDNVIYSHDLVRIAEGRAKALQRKKKSRSCHALVTPDVTPLSRSSSYSSSDSVSKETGGQAAAAPSAHGPPKNIWDLWVSLAVQCFKSEGECRNFLGGQIKKHGEEKVAEAVSATSLKGFADPKTYLLGILKDPEDVEMKQADLKYKEIFRSRSHATQTARS